jgi:hypothetical protein
MALERPWLLAVNGYSSVRALPACKGRVLRSSAKRVPPSRERAGVLFA